MQELIIIGNLTRNPESRTTSGGKNVTDFTVAVNRRKKADGTQEADFFRVSAWGQMGENCQKYLSKGSKVAVSGTVSANAYMGQDGQAKASLDVFAQNVEFLTRNGDSAGQTGSAAPIDVSASVSDELPF